MNQPDGENESLPQGVETGVLAFHFIGIELDQWRGDSLTKAPARLPDTSWTKIRAAVASWYCRLGLDSYFRNQRFRFLPLSWALYCFSSRTHIIIDLCLRFLQYTFGMTNSHWFSLTHVPRRELCGGTRSLGLTMFFERLWLICCCRF